LADGPSVANDPDPGNVFGLFHRPTP
jgi:hypothetical protein